jgi:hypothetical protein
VSFDKLLAGVWLATLAVPAAAAGGSVSQVQDRDVAGSVQDTTYTTQTSRGEVTLELQPAWRDGALEVAVSANTHSVDLSLLDLGELARLLVNDESIAPDEAGELSGHHGTTTLVFHLDQRPVSFSIEIRDVPDVPSRVLKWPATQETP